MMDMKELKCVAIALNKGDLLFYDQPLTISKTLYWEINLPKIEKM